MTEIIVRITCGFLITVCSIGIVLYFLIAKDFIEDYIRDKNNEAYTIDEDKIELINFMEDKKNEVE